MKRILILLLLIPTITFGQYRFENGVFPEIISDSTGHFYLKNHKGRDLLITPDGIGFYPIGINHLQAIYGNHNHSGLSETDATKTVLDHMDKWGFNCGGYGTGRELVREGIYYIGNLNLVKHGFYNLDNVVFPDVFDESFEIYVDETIKKTANAYYNPEKLIGVVWSDLPAWNIFKSRMLRQTDWVTEIRKLEKKAPGKMVYLNFLKKKYKNETDKLKEYYGLSDDDLDDLGNHDFSSLYLGHPMVMEDDELFMVEIARRYYELGAKYHEKYFPNTLLFGDRYLLGDHPDGILKIASQYVDAISIQVGDGFGETMLPSYPYPKSTIEHIHDITNKPVLIADHQISFYTNDYKRTIFSQAGNQEECSLETEKFLKATYYEEYVIGYFRCTYLTQKEPHGRGVKQGLVDFGQKPYSEIIEAYSTVNNDISKFIEK